MLNAQTNHDPARARALLTALKQKTTWPALAKRTGIHKRTLQYFLTGERTPDYAEQELFAAMWREDNGES